jgi:putative redox protein
MQELTSAVTLQTEMHFVAELDGHDIAIDADPQVGGQGLGPKPKGLMLTALAGCTAMDVISILRKMRIEPTAFSVAASAQVTDEHPRVFSRIHLLYRFQGDVPRDKAEKAIQLSQDRYCGVSAMLKQVVPIDWEILIEP